MLEGPQTLVVRPRHPADDAFILELAIAAFAPYAVAPARTVARFVRHPAARTYVATAGARMSGLAIVSVTRVRPWGPFANPSLAHLDAIAVASDARRHGIGRALLARAENHAIDRGAVSMSLMTAIDNHAARRLFTRSGYVELLERDGVYAGGRAAIHMFKPLG